jgi:hypothetical protein
VLAKLVVGDHEKRRMYLHTDQDVQKLLIGLLIGLFDIYVACVCSGATNRLLHSQVCGPDAVGVLRFVLLCGSIGVYGSSFFCSW